MPTQSLTTAAFKEKVFNYDNATKWAFAGERPALIDFYADWCGPCKAIAPVLEQLSEAYAGQLDIYKVDTDAETELSAAFGINSSPSLLFIPMKGQPMMQTGALPKHVLVAVIEKELLGKTDTQPAD
jgi:thioredoxin